VIGKRCIQGCEGAQGMIQFTAYCRPEPQGSTRAFVVKGRAVVTSDNRKLKPFRSEVTRCAMLAVADAGKTCPVWGKRVPVEVEAVFYLEKPPSIPKKITSLTVKPDLDKLSRALLDALTGIVYLDDSQVVYLRVSKRYGVPERVEVRASEVKEKLP
jgi:Holliday junction resolvase RusA-like endonuclease